MLYALAGARSTELVLWLHATRDRQHHPFASEVRRLMLALTHGRDAIAHMHVAACVTLGLQGMAGGCVGGLAPAVSFSSTSVGFGAAPVGTASSAIPLTLTNTGNAALTISGKQITGTNAGDFSQTNTCPGSLAASSSCTFSITFKPTASGARSASLVLPTTQLDRRTKFR
jgi:hypothetical protein